MFSTTDNRESNLDLTGLAHARTDVRALRVVMIPALAMEIVCDSMTSCSTDLVESDILSNSSMQQTPPSDSTSAPLFDENKDVIKKSVRNSREDL